MQYFTIRHRSWWRSPENVSKTKRRIYINRKSVHTSKPVAFTPLKLQIEFCAQLLPIQQASKLIETNWIGTSEMSRYIQKNRPIKFYYRLIKSISKVKEVYEDRTSPQENGSIKTNAFNSKRFHYLAWKKKIRKNSTSTENPQINWPNFLTVLKQNKTYKGRQRNIVCNKNEIYSCTLFSFNDFSNSGPVKTRPSWKVCSQRPPHSQNYF